LLFYFTFIAVVRAALVTYTNTVIAKMQQFTFDKELCIRAYQILINFVTKFLVVAVLTKPEMRE